MTINDEVAAFREWTEYYEWRQPELREIFHHHNEIEIQAAINNAQIWIEGRRWSWKVVAANFLLDGNFHA